jgi:hypothetical protein
MVDSAGAVEVNAAFFGKVSQNQITLGPTSAISLVNTSASATFSSIGSTHTIELSNDAGVVMPRTGLLASIALGAGVVLIGML